MRGGTIVPRRLKKTKGKKNFKVSQKNFFKIIMTPLCLLKIVFPNLIHELRQGWLCRSWDKISTFILLSLRLSGIEFPLVSD